MSQTNGIKATKGWLIYRIWHYLSLPWKIVILLLLVVLILYFPIGMLYVYTIDTNMKFSHSNEGKESVYLSKQLIRQMLVNHWVSNDSWFMPGDHLPNMKNYQQGVLLAITTYVSALNTDIAVSSTTDARDIDVEQAYIDLQYPPDVGLFGEGPTGFPSEDSYKNAMHALNRYNHELALRVATFSISRDSLDAYLQLVNENLTRYQGLIAQLVTHGGLWDSSVDSVFFNIKGFLYGTRVIFQGVYTDFQLKNNLQYKEINNLLAHVVALSPLIVTNGDLDHTFLGNHLNAELFYITQLKQQLNAWMEK